MKLNISKLNGKSFRVIMDQEFDITSIDGDHIAKVIPNGNHYIVNEQREPFGKVMYRMRHEWLDCILVTEFELQTIGERVNHPIFKSFNVSDAIIEDDNQV
jgi:hypothetical protein